MKKRNPWFVGVMTALTVGVYKVYWLVVSKKEMTKKGAEIPSLWFLFGPFLGILLIAFLQITTKLIVRADDPTQPAVSMVNMLSAIIGLASVISIIPLAIYWYWQFCQGIDHVTKHKTSMNYAFVWGFLASCVGLDFIWAGVIQDRLNKQAH